MKDPLKQLYPINSLDDKKVEALIDQETGEILDESSVERVFDDKSTDQLQKTLISKIKASGAASRIIVDEIENLKALLQVQLNREASAKKFLTIIMKHEGIDSLDFGTFGAKIKKNPPKVEIIDYSKLGDYVEVKMVTSEKLNKNKLKEDLKNKKVAGARIIQDERIEIF